MAEPFHINLKESDFKANKVDPPIWKHCFKLSMRGKPEHVIACASVADRDHWIRCYNLIIQMKIIGLNSMMLNIFTFEKFLNHQRKVTSIRLGLIEDLVLGKNEYLSETEDRNTQS